MGVLIFVLSLTLLLVPSTVHAARTPQLTLPIAPLDCIIETIATGTGLVNTITCPTPEPPPTPPPGETTEEPTNTPAPINTFIPRTIRTPYQEALINNLETLPPTTITTPIQIPNNRRFGIQLHTPSQQQTPPNIVSISETYTPIVILALTAIATISVAVIRQSYKSKL